VYEVDVRISTGCVNVRASISGECVRVGEGGSSIRRCRVTQCREYQEPLR